MVALEVGCSVQVSGGPGQYSVRVGRAGGGMGRGEVAVCSLPPHEPRPPLTYMHV